MLVLEQGLVGGKYRILRRLGEGGVAEVFEAVHEEIGQRVAIKVLRQDFTRTPEVAERFLTEARVAGTVGHPGIVQVYDYGHLPSGEPYLIMELLVEEDLHKILQRVKRFELDYTIGIMLNVLDALDAAHRAGVVHRDMKPENVIVTRGPGGEPWAKIIDFGIARVTSAGAAPARQTAVNLLFGTPHYLSPEQARCQRDIDARADIYAVGVMLFELLTGRLPYEGNSAAEVVERVLIGAFPKPRSFCPSLSAEIEQVILKATAQRREDRYASAKEFRDALLPFRGAAASTVARPLARLTLSKPAAVRPAGGPDRPATGPGAGLPRRTRPLRAWGTLAAAVVGVTTLVAVAMGSSSGPAIPSVLPAEAAVQPGDVEAAPLEAFSLAGAVCRAETSPFDAARELGARNDAAVRRSRALVKLAGLPPGARPSVDGRAVGVVFPLEVSDELHTLRVTGRGWKPFVHVFRVRGDLTLPVQLKPRGSAVPPAGRDRGTARPGTRVVGQRQPLGNPFGGR